MKKMGIKKWLDKVLAGLLCGAMIAGSVPATVFASETIYEQEEETVIIQDDLSTASEEFSSSDESMIVETTGVASEEVEPVEVKDDIDYVGNEETEAPENHTEQTINGADFFTTADTNALGATRWESSNPNVVEVTDPALGILKAHKSGSVKITAYFGEKGKRGTATVAPGGKIKGVAQGATIIWTETGGVRNECVVTVK